MAAFMMARRHKIRSPISPQYGSNNGQDHLEKNSSSVESKITPKMLGGAILGLPNNMRAKTRCVLGIFMIVVVISLLNNVGIQQHHNTSKDDSTAAVETELLQALYELPLPTTQQELIELNDELAGLEPKFILQWANHAVLVGNNGITFDQSHQGKNRWNTYHPLVQVTSFGPTGLVILDHLSRHNLLDNIPVITMDTLHLFKESYAFYDTVKSHYKSTLHLTITKPVHITHPPELHGESVFKGYISNKAEFQDVYSSTLWMSDPNLYTQLVKLDPMQQKFEEWQTIMWMTGRRRSQGGEREEIDVLEFETFPRDKANQRVKRYKHGNSNPFHPSKGRWKLNPLAYWSYDQVWKYIRDNNVPYNPLYDQGYTSIGDEMTTSLPKKSVENAIDERSGRFFGLNRTECGLHTHLQKVKALKKQKKESGEELEVPELKCEKCIELNAVNFVETVVQNTNNIEKNEGSLLLLEFYSPFCGSCQEFAPTLNRLANDQIHARVARFDITEQSIPKINNKEIFKVEATPTLYLVRNSPSFYAERYTGKHHEYDDILRWLAKRSSFK